MGNIFTLDSLREEAEKQFAPVKIGMSDGSEVVLRSLLRLGKDDRKTVVKALDEVNELNDETEDEDAATELLIEVIGRIFTVIADKPAKLMKELDHADADVKLSLLSKVLKLWAKETQLGEA